MRAPDFWNEDGRAARLLTPLGALYAAAGAARRLWSEPWTAPVPVFCVGNLTAGGTGKTPLVDLLARHLIAQGRRAAILSRGYGGAMRGPVAVDPAAHRASDVGDEPLLLARRVPVYVARDRKAAAELALIDGADVLVMDDGFQNPRLAKTMSFIVVDGEAGFGNRRTIPAGPLREPVRTGFARADALVMVGADRHAAAYGFEGPVLRADLVPVASDLAGVPVFAFAGIGRPEKFFDTLRGMGAAVRGTRAFADHHPYSRREIEDLIAAAKAQNALPVTTEKDMARLPADLAVRVRSVPVELRFADPAAFAALVARGLA
jgi:tetraacyldisaccharide 4'-kinase